MKKLSGRATSSSLSTHALSVKNTISLGGKDVATEPWVINWFANSEFTSVQKSKIVKAVLDTAVSEGKDSYSKYSLGKIGSCSKAGEVISGISEKGVTTCIDPAAAGGSVVKTAGDTMTGDLNLQEPASLKFLSSSKKDILSLSVGGAAYTKSLPESRNVVISHNSQGGGLYLRTKALFSSMYMETYKDLSGIFLETYGEKSDIYIKARNSAIHIEGKKSVNIKSEEGDIVIEASPKRGIRLLGKYILIEDPGDPLKSKSLVGYTNSGRVTYTVGGGNKKALQRISMIGGITSICSDEDGCTYRLGMKNWDADSDGIIAFRSGTFHMKKHSPFRWRAARNFRDDVQGVNDDHSAKHVHTAWACTFTEADSFSRVNGAFNDTEWDFGLYYDGSRGPNTECSITFID